MRLPRVTRAQPLRMENRVMAGTSRGAGSSRSSCCTGGGAAGTATALARWLQAPSDVFPAGSPSPPLWVSPARPKRDPTSQPTAWLLTCSLPQESPFATALNQLLRGSREGGLEQTHAETPRREQQRKPCPVHVERVPQPLLGKWGGVFSCFASSSPVGPGSRPCCTCLSGLNVIRQGQNLQVSLSLGYNGSVEKSSAPAGCNTAPREGGQPGSAVGTQAPAARHLPPFGTSGHCCFPLTSCLRSPDRKQNG